MKLQPNTLATKCFACNGTGIFCVPASPVNIDCVDCGGRGTVSTIPRGWCVLKLKWEDYEKGSGSFRVVGIRVPIRSAHGFSHRLARVCGATVKVYDSDVRGAQYIYCALPQLQRRLPVESNP